MPENKPKEMFTLPDGTVTSDPAIAAEKWATAFYRAKDSIVNIMSATIRILNRHPVRNLDEIIAECQSVLELGGRI